MVFGTEIEWEAGFLAIDKENMEQEIEHRLKRLKGKYIIACDRKDGTTLYLQDRAISTGGYWTIFMSNARVFENQNLAQITLQKFNFTNKRILKVRRNLETEIVS
jgi:hypothetical protein